MKARLPITNKEIAMAKEYMAKLEPIYMRRILKVVCYVLYNEFNFGIGRLGKVIDSANETMADMSSNEVIWDSIDRKLRDIGLEFEDEDYEEREARAKELRKGR